MALHKKGIPEAVPMGHALSGVLICKIMCEIINKRYLPYWSF